MNKYTFTVSHDANGFAFIEDELKKVIFEPDDVRQITARIEGITKYNLPIGETASSYFVYKGYIVFVDAIGKRDTRNFLERKITVDEISDTKTDYFRKLADGHSTAERLFESSALLKADLYEAIVLSALSKKTKIYFLTDNRDVVGGIHDLIYKVLPSGLLFRSSCIEAVGIIPDIERSAVICRCMQPGDRENYLRKISMETNRILVEWFGEYPKIRIDIDDASYAQRMFNELLRKKVGIKVSEILERASCQVSLSTRDEAAYPVIAYLAACMSGGSKELFRSIPISDTEKKNIKNYLEKGGRAVGSKKN